MTRHLEIVTVRPRGQRQKWVTREALDREIAIDRIADALYGIENRYELAEQVFDAIVRVSEWANKGGEE